MQIESKMSGWSITDIDNVKLITNKIITFGEMNHMKEKTIKWLLKSYAFSCWNKIDEDFCTTFGLSKEYVGKTIYCAIIDGDDEYKIAIMENYPEIEQELKNAFGENWTDYYLRFNH